MFNVWLLASLPFVPLLKPLHDLYISKKQSLTKVTQGGTGGDSEEWVGARRTLHVKEFETHWEAV